MGEPVSALPINKNKDNNNKSRCFHSFGARSRINEKRADFGIIQCRGVKEYQ